MGADPLLAALTTVWWFQTCHMACVARPCCEQSATAVPQQSALFSSCQYQLIPALALAAQRLQ